MDLTVALGPDDRSRLTARRVSFPWSLGRGYPGAPGQPVKLIPQSAGAGLLAGDKVAQHIRVAPGASVHLQSAGAMLTYGTPGGACSVSEWTVVVEPSARAFLMSEPYVLFEDAALAIRQKITITPDATLVTCDGVVPATASNTIEWQTETRVCRPDGIVLLNDRQRASPFALARQRRMPGAWSCFGTVNIFAPETGNVRTALEEATLKLNKSVWIGVAPVSAGLGLCVRIASKDGQALRDALLACAEASMKALQISCL
ncbi:MAG: urease accessory protein UreD [Pseudomonadota bacterium]